MNIITPVIYTHSNKSFLESALETTSDYFYLGGRKAHVIGKEGSQEQIVFSKANASLLGNIAKVFSYFTFVIPLIALTITAFLHSCHTFKVLDIESELQKNLQIDSPTVIKELDILQQSISSRADHEKIHWLSKGNNLVFTLTDFPGLVFKQSLVANDPIKSRFENIKKAKEICLIHKLGLLVIPQVTTVSSKAGTTLVEQSLDFNPTESAQKKLYLEGSDRLQETVRQVATFVAHTGFNDVTWRNIPLLNESCKSEKSRQVALIDLEHMNNAVNGFTGDGNGSVGLVGCVAKKHMNLVFSEAQKQGILIPKAYADYSKKQKEIQVKSMQELKAFYEAHHIKNGDEPILFDESLLSFPNHKKEHSAKLKQLSIDLLHEINRQIQSKSPDESPQGKRYICIDTNSPENPFYRMDSTYPDDSIKPYSAISSFKTYEEDQNATYLGCAVKKLEELGLIHKLENRNGCGYCIQA